MSETPQEQQPTENESHGIVVVGPDGRPLGVIPSGPADSEPSEGSVADLVEQPAKVMRIGSMIKQLLEEVRSAPLDEAGRAMLRDIHKRSIVELESGLAPELVAELDRLSLPFTEDSVPSEAELRIAQAQLVGWLEGLFHGIQTALFAQQMAAQAQLEQMRHGRPRRTSPARRRQRPLPLTPRPAAQLPTAALHVTAVMVVKTRDSNHNGGYVRTHPGVRRAAGAGRGATGGRLRGRAR